MRILQEHSLNSESLLARLVQATSACCPARARPPAGALHVYAYRPACLYLEAGGLGLCGSVRSDAFHGSRLLRPPVEPCHAHTKLSISLLPLDRKPIMKIHVEYFVLKSFEHIAHDIGLRHKLIVPLQETSATGLQTSRQVLQTKGPY